MKFHLISFYIFILTILCFQFVSDFYFGIGGGVGVTLNIRADLREQTENNLCVHRF